MTRRELGVDGAIAGAFIALGIGLALGLDLDGGELARAVPLVVLHDGALVLRRRRPVGVLGVMVLTGILTPMVGIPTLVLGPAALVAVHSVAARVAPPRSTVAAAVAVAGMAVSVLLSGMGAATVLTNAIAFAVAWWLGDRNRRSAADAAEWAQRAVVDERLRLARELHDVVAHSMSVIAVQAGSGRLVIDRSPAAAKDALAVIEETSRAALQEMRRLLDVLRDDGDPTSLAPAPGLADLAQLVAASAAAGVPVDVRTEGAPVTLPAGVDLCAYRVVQEALTNVRRHARATTASVVVRYREGGLEVEVRDDGVGATRPARPGHGLAGLRERTALYGGTLVAGPTASGFSVRATIPVGPA